MSEQSKEKVSELVDGELGSGSESAMNELLHTASLQGSWARYHLISDTLQKNIPETIDTAFAARISASIQDEPSILAPTRSNNAFLKPIAGFAIAASVAAMAILGIQHNQNREGGQEPQVVSFNPQSKMEDLSVQRVGYDNATEAHLKKVEANTRARLNSYLVNYNEYRSHSGFQGMLPYARTVTFENNK